MVLSVNKEEWNLLMVVFCQVHYCSVMENQVIILQTQQHNNV